MKKLPRIWRALDRFLAVFSPRPSIGRQALCRDMAYLLRMILPAKKIKKK